MAVELTKATDTRLPEVRPALTTALPPLDGFGGVPGTGNPALTGDTTTGLTGVPGAQATLGLEATNTPGGLPSSGPPDSREFAELITRDWGFVDVALVTPDRPDAVLPSYNPSTTPPIFADPKPKPEELPPQKPAEGLTFKSWGDPHEVTGDGHKFDNQMVGDFVAMRSKSGDLELQKRHENVNNQKNGVTFNTEASLKTNGDVIHFDSQSDVLSINGKAANLANGQSITLPGGATVTRNGGNYTINTKQGDSFTFTDQGKYMDIEGKLSTSRADGEVIGSLGRFDADSDASNDLVMPDGTMAKDVNQFLEAWRVGAPNAGTAGKLIPGYAIGDPTGPTVDSLAANKIMADALAAVAAEDEKRQKQAAAELLAADQRAAAAKPGVAAPTVTADGKAEGPTPGATPGPISVATPTAAPVVTATATVAAK